MNIYKQLNALTAYIEDNLENDLNPAIMARFLHTDEYTASKLFSVLTGQSFASYVRKRRLSLAGYDLYMNHPKIIDIAMKYGYSNATAFSRAFEKFHNIKPSHITENTKLKNLPKLKFNEKSLPPTESDYEIINLPELNLSGISIKTNNTNISHDAPNLFSQITKTYQTKYGDINYGMTTYDWTRAKAQRYYCLFKQKIIELEQVQIPASKWLKFTIDSRNASAIQATTQKFYREFLPSCKYTLRPLPELENYHDQTTDFLVAIQ